MAPAKGLRAEWVEQVVTHLSEEIANMLAARAAMMDANSEAGYSLEVASMPSHTG
jgi:hypothetical protein